MGADRAGVAEPCTWQCPARCPEPDHLVEDSCAGQARARQDAAPRNGALLEKYTNKAKARAFKKRITEIIGDTDYSLGGDHTAELMHKTVLADLDTNEHCVPHEFDVSNAHNEFDRTEALDVIRTEIPEMMPWVLKELCTETYRAYLGSSGEILWIKKSMGGDQGDPIVALLFPLLYSRAIKAAFTAANTPNQPARAYSYQDDLDIIHAVNVTEATSKAFDTACKKVGLRASQSKEPLTPGSRTNVRSLPHNYKVDPRLSTRRSRPRSYEASRGQSSLPIAHHRAKSRWPIPSKTPSTLQKYVRPATSSSWRAPSASLSQTPKSLMTH